jgi:hypothetical protein
MVVPRVKILVFESKTKYDFEDKIIIIVMIVRQNLRFLTDMQFASHILCTN